MVSSTIIVGQRIMAQPSAPKRSWIDQNNPVVVLLIVLAAVATIIGVIRSQFRNTQEVEYVGRVLDSRTLKPIPDAKVTLDIQGAPPVVYADTEGVYRFLLTSTAQSVAGRVRVDASDYAPYNRNITLYANNLQLEDLRLNPTTTPAASALPPPSSTPSGIQSQSSTLPTSGLEATASSVVTSTTSTPKPTLPPELPTVTATQTSQAAPTPTVTQASGQIAFTSNRDGNNEIYVMRADGSDQTRLTNDAANDSDPVWSPDERYIASSRRQFLGLSFLPAEIYLMQADGSQQRRLTDNLAEDGEPTWSPDGQYIAFTSTQNSNDEIYTMWVDDRQQTQLTNNASNDWGPAWSPR
jgi:TolB protein